MEEKDKTVFEVGIRKLMIYRRCVILVTFFFALLWIAYLGLGWMIEKTFILAFFAGLIVYFFLLNKARNFKCPQCGGEFFYGERKLFSFRPNIRMKPLNRECDQCGLRINFI